MAQRLDRIIARRLSVLVGDANGADKAVQEYLRSKQYDLVEVFCSGGSCRNNSGHWPVRTVPVSGQRKDFAFYATKDRAMADEATVGLMLWDRESVGTLMNVFRLVSLHKKVVLFIDPDHEFVDLKDYEDWARLVAGCAAPLRDRIESEAAAERSPRVTTSAPVQASWF